MKQLKVFLASCLVIFAFASCGTDYGDLIDDGGGSSSSNLPGTWSIDLYAQYVYVDGILEDSEETQNIGTMTFNSNGDGSYSITQDGETMSGSFEWFEKNDKLFMNFLSLSQDVITDNFAIAWDVTLDTSTSQKWQAEISQYVDNEDYNTGQITRQLQKTEIKFECSKN